MTSHTHYKPVPVGVNATVVILGSRIGGFVAATPGTITITVVNEHGVSTALPGIPVAAGADVDIPIQTGTVGRSTLVASGGASGILLMS